MSLDFSLHAVRRVEVFSSNITHNLTSMAREAGIYEYLWHPENLNIGTAKELIEPIRVGLALLKSDPTRFKAFDAPNGWGTYDNFVPWVEYILQACIDNPDAEPSTDC